MDQPQERLWNRNYVFLLSLSAVTATAFNMVTPTLPRFAVELGAGLTVAGTLAGIFAITALVVRPFSGLAVDRLNKKWLLVGSTAMMTLAVIGYTLSHSIGLLFAFRILHGAAFSISGTTNTSLACSYVPPRRLGEGVGYLGLGYILATAVGPSLGLGLADAYGYQVSFGVSAALFALAASLMLLISYRHPQRAPREAGERRPRIQLSDLFARELLIYALLAAIISLSNGVVNTFISLFAQDRGIPSIGLYFTVSAFSMLGIRLVGGRLLDRYGLAAILYPAYLIAGLSMFLLAGARALPLVLVSAAMRSVGQSAAQPALQATCIRKLGPARSGVATSTFFVGADVGQGLGPIIGGAISETWSYGAMYTGTGVVLLLGMAIYALHARRERPLPAEAP
ncbi:MAG: MFS transporter, partial [Anaerolineae bacterium]